MERSASSKVRPKKSDPGSHHMSSDERIRTRVLDDLQINRKVQRIADQLHERYYKESEIVFVGIAPRGTSISRELVELLESMKAFTCTDVELKMDKDAPESTITMSADVSALEGKVVVLVDDVLQSGRTLMYAAAHLMQVKLKKLTTVVLIDRRHRSFPIRADIVGLTLSTTMQEHITVDLGDKSAVYLD